MQACYLPLIARANKYVSATDMSRTLRLTDGRTGGQNYDPKTALA